MPVDESVNVKTKRKHKNKKIKFDEEVLTKEGAEKLIESISTQNNTASENEPKKTKTKRRFSEPIETDVVEHITESNTETTPTKKKKRTKPQVEQPVEISNEVTDVKRPEGKKTESIRERKRKKHFKLLEDKKMKSEVNMQQKCLNYLSMWKHSRETWKFEKLKQIWLQQNIFDNVKIPEEFWETLIEYFDQSKGNTKSVILKEALKIIEDTANCKDEEIDKNNFKYERARFIIQNLQE